MNPTKRTSVEIDGHELSLSNLDKVLYPATGFTKGDLINYYVEVAPAILPHLLGRPLTMKRYPNGVAASSFYEKHLPVHAPEWLARTTVARHVGSEAITYAIVDSLAALVWVANLASIELHVPMWRADGIEAEQADLMVFDLDPGPNTTILDCIDVAMLIREHLANDGLRAAPKTSGKKGMQLYVRLPETRDWNEVIDNAHELGREIEREHGDLVVTNMRRDLRHNKVLIDWSQNNAAKTTIAPYSLRAEERPTVSTPVSWDELAAARTAADVDLLVFDAAKVIERVHKNGDVLDQQM